MNLKKIMCNQIAPQLISVRKEKGLSIQDVALQTPLSMNMITLIEQGAPDGEYLNCNVAVDPTNQYLYIAVSNAYSESEIPTKNYLLIYDCSGETSKLVKKIENQTCYPIGVFPMRKFYN